MHVYLLEAIATKYPRGDGPISAELKEIYDQESKVDIRPGVCVCARACVCACVLVWSCYKVV